MRVSTIWFHVVLELVTSSVSASASFLILLSAKDWHEESRSDTPELTIPPRPATPV